MRFLRYLIPALAGCAAIAAFGWFVALPEYRPSLREGESYGVDVSNHQERVDWPAVANDNIDFAYVKASEGSDFVDDKFASHWKGARSQGLRTGAYHFFTFCSTGVTQAENFLRVVPRDSNTLPPAIDLELAGNCSQRPARDIVEHEVHAFVDAVEAAVGKPVILYIGDDFEDKYSVSDWLDKPVWQPNFVRRPAGLDWQIWQVMGFARVEGIDGKADLDIARPGLL